MSHGNSIDDMPAELGMTVTDTGVQVLLLRWDEGRNIWEVNH
tara:strand:- start:2221 stop:2346 length:126 start_codon:yes stop_codon:yes gene_type:complete